MKKFLSPLIILLSAGTRGQLNSSQSRITIMTNVMAIWGLLSIGPLISVLENNGVGFDVYGVSFCIFAATCIIAYCFNFFFFHRLARISAVILVNFLGYQAAVLYGKTFNGFWVFFIAISYIVIAFSRERKAISLSVLGVTLLGLPIVDFLHAKRMIPITHLDSANFGLSLLWVDTFSITFFCALMLIIEKTFYDKYEDELENLNQNLEDIVEQKIQLLVKAKEEAISASLLKSQFVANTSHELRTPIQGLVGFVTMAQKRISKMKGLSDINLELRDKALKSLYSSEKSSVRLLNLIDTLLKMTSAEGSGFRANPQKFNLKKMTNELCDLLQSKQQEPVLDVKMDLRSEEIFSDRTLVCQVFENIIANAQRYGDLVSKISVYITETDNEIIFSVINKGIGVPSKEVDEIFEPFVQSSATDQRTGGTGLGLSLCRKYAKALRGRVLLTDPSPDHTEFKFYFAKHYSSKQLPVD